MWRGALALLRSGALAANAGSGGGGSSAATDVRSAVDLPSLAALVEAQAADWAAAEDKNSFFTAFNKACKLGMVPNQRPSDDDPQRAQLLHHTLDTLAAAYLPLVPRLPAAKWCTMPLWACAKAGYWGGGLAAALLEGLGRGGGALMRKADGQGHANVWWSLSLAPKELIEAGQAEEVLDASACSLQRMGAASIGPQACSNVLLACARLQRSPTDLLHHLTACLAAQPDATKCQELANGLYALGKLREDGGHTPQPQDLQRLVDEVSRRLAGGLHVAGSSGGEGGGDRFIPQHMSNILLGCAKLGYTDAGLLRPLAAAAGQAAGRMKKQELANSLYTLAVLGCKDPAYAPAVVQLAAECKRRNFTGFIPQNLANSAWALATLGYHSDQGWFAAAVAAAMRPDAMKVCIAQNLAMLWYGLALVRHRPEPTFLKNTAAAFEVLRTQANGQDCANLLWSLATLGVPYEPRLVGVLVERLVELLPQRGAVSEQALSNSLWALAEMGPDALSRHQRPVEALLREVVRQWDQTATAAVNEGSGAGRFSGAGLRQLWRVQQELERADGCSRLLGMVPNQRPSDDDPQRAQLLHHTLDTLASAYLPLVPRLAAAKWCVMPLWACAKAGYWGGGLAEALLQRLGRGGGALMRKANDQDHANVWWSLSEAPEEVLQAEQAEEVLDASADSLQRMGAESIGPQACSNVLLACARLQRGSTDLLHHLTACLAAQPGANCQDVANGLYALGELREDCSHTPQPQDLQRLASGAVERLSPGTSQNAGSSGWNGGGGDRFVPQALSNMLLGCAKLKCTDASLLRPLAAAVGRAAGRMEEQGLANSLNALAVLGCVDPAYAPAVVQLADECKRRNFTGFNPQDLSNSAWALGKLGYHSNQGWFAAAVVAAMRPGVLEGFTTQNFSNLWYGLALARHRPESAFVEGTAVAFEVLRTGADAQSCANLLWSLATLDVPYEPRLVGVLVGRLVELLSHRGAVSEQNLTNSLWALAVMGSGVLSRHQRPVEALLREVVRRWNQTAAAGVIEGSGAGRFTAVNLGQLWRVQQELERADGCSGLVGIMAGGGGAGSKGSLLSAMRHAASKGRAEADARPDDK
ncbi:hypothetical protein TSOC_013890, partial [Tetrabaena socialis]